MSLADATAAAFGCCCRATRRCGSIIWVSLKTSVIGLLLATPVAVLLGYAIASYRFPGRRVAIWLAQAALSLPTVLIGLLLYLLLSRHGPWGALHWLFTQPGIILGQFIIAHAGAGRLYAGGGAGAPIRALPKRRSRTAPRAGA